MVMPSVGFSSTNGTRFWTIPAMAPAALPSTRREMALIPATSTTEGMIVMSLEPT